LVKVKALGLVKQICGWQEMSVDASDIDSVLTFLPTEIIERLKVGDILLLLNGAESSSLEKRNVKLSENDEVVLLPVVHGG
jgi:molybdopterin converting factor small subunit